MGIDFRVDVKDLSICDKTEKPHGLRIAIQIEKGD
jgi:hypothetical protein